MKNRQNLLSITIVMFVILGILASILVGAKIISTSVQLELLASKIRYTEEVASKSPSGWSDDTVARYDSLQEKRLEFTESRDPVVKWFANLNTGIKLLVIAFVVVTWIAAIMLVYSFLSYTYKQICKRRKRRCKAK